MKGLILLLLISLNLGSLDVYSQQDPRFTLFNYNGVYMNPAIAGSKEQINLVGLYRHQWAGYGGAPHTTTFTVDMPVFLLRSAVGLSVMKESIGIVNNNYFGFTYAAIAHLSTHARFSLGAQIGINQLAINFSDVITDPTNSGLYTDGSLNFGNNVNQYKPQIGLGLYYYDRKYKFGFSIPSVNSYNYFGVENGGKKQNHYFVTAGINFRLSPKLEYNPRTLCKITENAPMQYELFNQFIYMGKYTLGATIRSQEAVAATIGVRVHKQFNFAYAYDLAVFNKLNNYQSGSHEIMLNYMIPVRAHDQAQKKFKSKRKHKCIDFDDKKDKKKFFKDVEDIFYDRN